MITSEQSRAARGLLDWSQERLALEAQISRQTIVDFERGVRRPVERSLIALQQAFETARVEFIPPGRCGLGPGVRLLPSIWRLKPKKASSANWRASTYCGEVVIRAVSEEQARSISSRAFGIAVRRLPDGQTIENPWARMSDEVACERLTRSKYSEPGPDAILNPAEYDNAWKT